MKRGYRVPQKPKFEPRPENRSIEEIDRTITGGDEAETGLTAPKTLDEQDQL
jgi:hypothetical protein